MKEDEELELHLRGLELSVGIFNLTQALHLNNSDFNCDYYYDDFNMHDIDNRMKEDDAGFIHKISEESLDTMTKIPSKCDRCGLECPSKQALQQHKT